MPQDVSFFSLILILIALAAVFALFASFKMPSRFKENQSQRDELRRKMVQRDIDQW